LVDGAGQSISGVLTLSGHWPRRRVVTVPAAEIVGIENNIVSLAVGNKAIALMPVQTARKYRAYQRTANTGE
jgi:hypothetical protein